MSFHNSVQHAKEMVLLSAPYALAWVVIGIVWLVSDQPDRAVRSGFMVCTFGASAIGPMLAGWRGARWRGALLLMTWTAVNILLMAELEGFLRPSGRMHLGAPIAFFPVGWLLYELTALVRFVLSRLRRSSSGREHITYDEQAAEGNPDDGLT